MGGRIVAAIILSTIFLQYNAGADMDPSQINSFNPNGMIPSPFKLKTDYSSSSFLAKSGINSFLSSLPASYDLRENKRDTPVKSQADNTCWAFAACASMESSLLRPGMTDWLGNSIPASEYDLSENHMKHSTSTEAGDWGFSRQYNGGGNRDIAVAYYARLEGAVLEKNDPYSGFDSERPDAVNRAKITDRYIDKAMFIPEPVTASGQYYMQDVNFRNKVKQAVMEYGAIFTGLYMDCSSQYYNTNTAAYLYNGNATVPNHAVCIVGWDDSYSRNNFPSPPASDGAFIVKNSWGKSWGKDGYFYVSYADKFIGEQATVFVMSPVKHSYKSIYQYDPLGMVGAIGYGGTTAWFANVFNVKYPGSERLETIGFYSAGSNAQFQIYLANVPSNMDINGGYPTTLVASMTTPYPGYYTVDLSSPYILSKEKLIIQIRVYTPDTQYNIPVEYPYNGYSDSARASPRQSYIKMDNSNIWVDITSTLSNYNVCIKAFSVDMAEYRATFTQSSIARGQPVQGRVYCNNGYIQAQNPKLSVTFTSGNRLLNFKIFSPQFAQGSSVYNFSIDPALPPDADLNSIVAKIFVTDQWGSSFKPLMRYFEEMKKN